MKLRITALLMLTAAVFSGQACSNNSMTALDFGEATDLSSHFTEKTAAEISKEIPSSLVSSNGILSDEATALAKSCPDILSAYGKSNFSSGNYVVEADFMPAVAMSCQKFKTDILGTQQGVLTQSIRLTEKCSFPSSAIQIGASNISLDCNDSVFTGGTASSMSKDYGLTFPVNDNPDKSADNLPVISNIRIRNCHFENYKTSGIFISNRFSRRLKADQDFYAKILHPMHNDGKFDVPGQSSPADKLRQYSPSKIALINVSVRNTQNAGIYIQNSVTKVDITQSKTLYTRLGIYLDYGTREISVRNTCFLYPGTPDPGSGISEDVFKGREGIAVDASANNQFANNLFYRTKSGAVTLYKNCWEGFDNYLKNNPNGTKQAQFPRRQRADNNVIKDNIVVGTGQAEEVGVSVAHRQFKSFLYESNNANATAIRCGDVHIDSFMSADGERRVYNDYARNNLIQGNTFFNVELPVRIWDDNNTFQNNVIRGTKSQYIARVGHSKDATYRNRSVKAVVGAKISNNLSFVKSMSSSNLIHFISSAAKTATTAQGNTLKTSGSSGGDETTPTPTPSPTPKPTVTPTPSLVTVDFSCAVSGNNNGCQKTVSCPSGKKVKEVRAACDLESGSVSTAEVNGTAWNQLKVVKASTVVAEGQCAVSITDKRAVLSSGSRSITMYSASSIGISCHEKDSNGGDCEIRGQLRCQ